MRAKHVVTAIVFSTLTFMGMYVAATMNAIGESYQAGLDSFKLPFRILTLVTLVVLAGWLVVAASSRRLRTASRNYLASVGSGVLLVSLLTFGLGYAPCLKPHPTTEPHHTHHNLKAVIERSLLCPSYSNRSWPGIFIYVLLGATTLGMSRMSGDENA